MILKQQFGKRIKMIGEEQNSNFYCSIIYKNNKYKRIFKPNSFDLVISDEAHRSLGASSRNVFEYFIGFKLGLTATPRDFLKVS